MLLDIGVKDCRPWLCFYTYAELRLTLCYPKDCGLPGSSVHGILQARILQWPMPSSRGIFPTQGSNPHHFTSPALAGRFFTTSATWEVHHFLNDNLKTTIRKRIWSENEEQSFKWKNSRLNRNFKMSHSFLILLHPNMNFVLNPCLRTTC